MSFRSVWGMSTGKVVEGIFALNKPTGTSSAQALRELQDCFDTSKLFAPWLAQQNSARTRESPNQRHRRKMKQIRVKIGHGGTLDPLATGVLIAGVGKGTKGLQQFLECTKTYETVIVFGASTDTYDRVGKILKRAPHHHITREMVEKALEGFRGKIMQLPPLYSALKMNGKPLYEYAREGKPIPRDIQKRAVEVKELVLLDFMPSGTHDYGLPTDEVEKAELAVAEDLWKVEREDVEEKKKQELRAEEDINAEKALAGMKRKFEEAQDALVREGPIQKKRLGIGGRRQEPTMSGALPSPEENNNGLEELPNEVEKGADRSPEDTKGTQRVQDGKVSGTPAVKIRMTVTSGFYVRSLAHDLGEAVHSQAFMAELVRTRQGQFELGKNVVEYSDFAKGEAIWGPEVEKYLDTFSADSGFSVTPATEAQAEPQKSHSTLYSPNTASEPIKANP